MKLLQATIVTNSLRAAGLAALLSLVGSTQAEVIYGVGVNDLLTGTAVSYTSWADVGVTVSGEPGSAQTHTSGPIAGTVDGVAFTYTITVTAVATSENLALQGGLFLLGTTHGGGGQNQNRFFNGEGYTVSIGNITESDAGLDVVFDGFTRFASSSTAFETEGLTVNGTSYLRPAQDGGLQNPATYPVWDLAAAPEATFSAVSVGTTTGRHVDFQFSTQSTSPSLVLDVVHNSATDQLTFTWDSQAGKVYDLRSSIDLETDGDPATWPVVAGQEGIAASPIIIARPSDAARFYVIQERDPS